jgi:hypothetical protein
VARTVAELPPGTRITDYISLGVITRTFPVSSRRNCRGVKRKMSNFPLRLRHLKPLPKINIREAVRALK